MIINRDNLRKFLDEYFARFPLTRFSSARIITMMVAHDVMDAFYRKNSTFGIVECPSNEMFTARWHDVLRTALEKELGRCS